MVARPAECAGVGVPVSAGRGGAVGWSELVGDLAEGVDQGMDLAAFPSGARPAGGVDVVHGALQDHPQRVGVPRCRRRRSARLVRRRPSRCGSRRPRRADQGTPGSPHRCPPGRGEGLAGRRTTRRAPRPPCPSPGPQPGPVQHVQHLPAGRADVPGLHRHHHLPILRVAGARCRGWVDGPQPTGVGVHPVEQAAVHGPQMRHVEPAANRDTVAGVPAAGTAAHRLPPGVGFR